MLKIILVVAALWTLVARGACADTPGAEIAATNLLFPEGTIFVGKDLYFVD